MFVLFRFEISPPILATNESPTFFRYVDWLLTVPLLIIEFYLILKAVTNVAASLFYKLFVGSIVMLVFELPGKGGPAA